MAKKLGRALVALVILPVVLLMTGCVKVDTSIEIKSADEIYVGVKVSIAEDQIKMMLGDVKPDELCKELLKESNTKPGEMDVTSDKADGYYSCTLGGKTSLQNLQAQMAKMGAQTGAGNNGDVSITIEGDKATFKATMSDASKELRKQLGGAKTKQMEEAARQLLENFTLSVTFPGNVESATGKNTISGRTVTWKVKDNMGSQEQLVAVGLMKQSTMGKVTESAGKWIKSTGGIVTMSVVGVLLLGGIATGAVLLTRKGGKKPKGKAKASVTAAGANGAAGMPQSTAPMGATGGAPTTMPTSANYPGGQAYPTPQQYQQGGGYGQDPQSYGQQPYGASNPYQQPSQQAQWQSPVQPSQPQSPFQQPGQPQSPTDDAPNLGQPESPTTE